jgi:nucleotide-binding universal stress UspA family protein
MLRKILIAFDGSEGPCQALKFALDLAKVHRAEVHAMAIAQRSPIHGAALNEMEKEQIFINDIIRANF